MRTTRITGSVLAGLAVAALLAGCGKKNGEDSKDGKGGLPSKPGGQVSNELKMIGLAMHNFHASLGTLPPAGPEQAPLLGPGVGLDPRKTPWRIALLPYLELDNLYKAIQAGNYKGGKTGGEYWLNPELLKLCPKIYQADPGDTRTRYRVFVGGGAAFEPNRTLRFPEFTDGLSTTILVVETEEAVPWTSTQELPYDPKKPLPKLGHPSRDDFYALMGDGSVRRIPKSTDEKLIRAMITRAGGEVIELPGQ
jgi:uncharacterized protein DUF1559